MTSDDPIPITSRRDSQVTLRLGGLKQWYKDEAARRGITPHALMILALDTYADDHTPDITTPPGPLARDEELADLVFNWGEWYAITVHGGGRRYLAQRRDGKGTLVADSAAGLRLKIVADNEADPVPREVSP
jgi:hypothetical protein